MLTLSAVEAPSKNGSIRDLALTMLKVVTQVHWVEGYDKRLQGTSPVGRRPWSPRKIPVQSPKMTVLGAQEELGEAPQLAQGPGVTYKWLEQPYGGRTAPHPTVRSTSFLMCRRNQVFK